MSFSSSSGLTIRPALLSDVPALEALETHSFTTDQIPARYFRRFLRDGRSTLLIAEKSDVFAGYVLVLYRANTKAGRLYSIAVSASARGIGVGDALLAAAEQATMRVGRNTLRLEVRPDNIGALRLYERHGYHVFGRYPGFYEDGADALRLEKLLCSDSTSYFSPR